MHVLSSSALKEWLVWTIQHLKLELHVGLAPLDCREMVEFVQVSHIVVFHLFFCFNLLRGYYVTTLSIPIVVVLYKNKINFGN